MALPLSKMDVHRQQYSEEKSSNIPLKRAGTDNDSRQSPSVMHGDESNEMDPRNVVPRSIDPSVLGRAGDSEFGGTGEVPARVGAHALCHQMARFLGILPCIIVHRLLPHRLLPSRLQRKVNASCNPRSGFEVIIAAQKQLWWWPSRNDDEMLKTSDIEVLVAYTTSGCST